MFDRPPTGEKAILVHVDFNERADKKDSEEFYQLALSAGADIVDSITTTRTIPDVKYFVGLGKAEEIKNLVSQAKIDLVLFNHSLSPSQERNLEKLLKCRVIDRTGLILDIFAQRAQSFEGKLQVELAQLNHLATRLVRGWTHLERQRGGIGLRGPGETQLESDRRLIRNRIKTIRSRLDKVQKSRAQNRRARQRSLLPTVALVGYTNVGKSTLFNLLSGAHVYVANKPFATLDPTMRQIALPGAGPIILADTVGFIRDLPHDLIEAFSATLEETREASLLIHVIDSQDESREAHIVQVNEVLAQIGAQNIPRLLVYNKIDLRPELKPDIIKNAEGKPAISHISVRENLGIDLLLQAIADLVYGDPVYRTITLTQKEGKLRALLYEMSAVLNEQVDDAGNLVLSIRMAKFDFERLFPNASLD
ncbi:MAG: ribosome rescue GTPase HflX [Gammaproteobacteria bacterium]